MHIDRTLPYWQREYSQQTEPTQNASTPLCNQRSRFTHSPHKQREVDGVRIHKDAASFEKYVQN